jgi:hypothetical protein
MGTVLATASQGDDPLDLLELFISVEVLKAIESWSSRSVFLLFIEDPFPVDIDVKPILGVQEALGHTKIDVDRFDLGLRAFAGHPWCDTVEFAVLIRDDQSTFEIDAHGDPRSLLFGRDLVDQFYLEAVGGSKRFGGCCT